jgi:AhpC/TSA family protein
MKKKLAVLLAAGLVAGVLAPQPSRQLRAENPPALKVGDEAPDFTLKYFDGTDLKSVSLHDYRGKKNVVLAFYIFAFTGG